MRLVVFGATGGTGERLVEQALQSGHTVTAVARRPEAIALQHPRLSVRRGDVLAAGDVEAAIAGHDAVLSALGAGSSRAPTTICRDGVGHMLAAMERCGVRRISCVSALGLGDGALQPWPMRLFMRHVLQPLLRHPFDDLRAMEARLRESPLEWTIVRPPRLTNGERVGRYRYAIDTPLARALTISRADLADYMLAHLDDRATVRTLVEVAY
ncbi:NAD(P)-dependent oxidoreductase [Nannocystis punicea]|uniref:SDR family oxidoreductase n=1 Tax=Nannocystis punicea TaxID=2995304 RepID=A0ABY7HJX4_9BACT|nr:NAD(P)-binding oxidoreductase [Nannocystis poenicansa]WAS99578.1 SDR family oxidoreductase [Nannocystis poenicansa]